MYPSSRRILTRLIEFLLVASALFTSSMQRSESESFFLELPEFVSCSVVVSILANGRQKAGNVSIKVGREFVKNGFIYL